MRLGHLALLAVGIAAGCAPTIGTAAAPVEVLVILDSLDDSLRIIPVDSPTIVHTIALTHGEAPNSMALFGSEVAIGLNSSVEVISLGNHQPICPLTPLGAGAPISALTFDNNGLGYAAAPGSKRVSTFGVVQASSCTEGHDTYSGSPQGFGNARGTVFVVNSNSQGEPSCVPAPVGGCPSWLTYYPHGADSIPIPGPGNARAGIFASDNSLYVISAGTGSAPDGILSQFDPLQNGAGGGPIYPGFGHLPTYLATNSPTADRIYITSPVDSGLMIFNVRTHQVEKGFNNPVALGGSSRGVTVDDLGQIYVLLAGSCSATGTRGSVYVLGQDLVAMRNIPVGRCPIAIGATEIPAASYDFH
jgi:hypothetical protein